MEEKPQLSGLNLFFLWFGAAVSVAEILTGGYLAELGAVKGLWAILLGHLAGTILLVLAGLIGFRERLPAIMSTRISFGKQGSYIISLINILQLVGWTAIMIIEGGAAMNVIGRSLWNFDHPTLMSCLIGCLVGLWVFWGVKGFKRVNTLAASLLLILTIVMSWVVLTHPSAAAEMAKQKGAFGMGFELSIIMPLSWFPLISDYTSLARTNSRLSPPHHPTRQQPPADLLFIGGLRDAVGAPGRAREEGGCGHPFLCADEQSLSPARHAGLGDGHTGNDAVGGSAVRAVLSTGRRHVPAPVGGALSVHAHTGRALSAGLDGVHRP